MRPVPAPPPGEPVDRAKALVHSSTVELWVLTSELEVLPSGLSGLAKWESLMASSLPFLVEREMLRRPGRQQDLLVAQPQAHGASVPWSGRDGEPLALEADVEEVVPIPDPNGD